MAGDEQRSRLVPIRVHLTGVAVAWLAMLLIGLAVGSGQPTGTLVISGDLDDTTGAVSTSDAESESTVVTTETPASGPERTAGEGTVADLGVASSPSTTDVDTAPEATDVAPVSSAAPTTELQRSLPPATFAPAARRLEIRTVPPITGFAFEIGDRTFLTDDDGAVMIDGADELAVVEAIGRLDPVQSEDVTVLGWSDGNTDARRPLAQIGGPVVQLGLEIGHLVVLELDPRVRTVETVLIDSPQVGPLEMTIGEPTWVVGVRAVEIDGRFIAEDVVYGVAESETVGKGIYNPEPDAVWRVTP